MKNLKKVVFIFNLKIGVIFGDEYKSKLNFFKILWPEVFKKISKDTLLK